MPVMFVVSSWKRSITFFMVNILVAIVLEHYQRLRDESSGHLLDQGLLTRVYRIIAKALPKDQAQWLIGKMEKSNKERSSSSASVEAVTFTKEDRERLIRLEHALETLLNRPPETPGKSKIA